MSNLRNLVCGCLLLALFAVGKRKANWHGSKLGTEDYNKELEVIEDAKTDLVTAMRRENFDSRRELLCVTFIRVSLEPTINLLSNIMHSKHQCDWAILIYDGRESEVSSLCKNKQLEGHAVICRKTTNNLENSGSRAVPKTALYADLLPVLPSYKRVFLMDEDISLVGFDIHKYLKVWDCTFPNQDPPLISQPTVAEDTQYFAFVSQVTWEKSNVLATASGIVEQQVPFFDAIFFEWFVRRVISRTREFALENGADWGHDRSWCNAAAMYVRQVLHWNESAVPCAILVATDAVHHLNTRSMKNKRANKTTFRAAGSKVVQRWIDTFPTWVLLNVEQQPNPLDRTYGSRFIKIKGSTPPDTCPEHDRRAAGRALVTDSAPVLNTA